MSAADFTVRPLSDRLWINPKGRTRSKFTSTWANTLVILGDEVRHLKGRNLVIEVDVTEGDLRLDGNLRARVAPTSPAVIVSYDSVHGPMKHRADRFSGGAKMEPWQHNVRAVALTLEALRACDRYGATASHEQYTGFLAIEAPKRASIDMSVADAVNHLLAASEWPDSRWPDDADERAVVVKRARRETHPDRAADKALFNVTSDAVDVLTRVGMLN